MNILLAFLMALFLSSCVSAPSTSLPAAGPLPEHDANIGYKTPEEALNALRQKPGVQIRNEQGWTIADDRAEFTVWSFTPQGHPAYPSVVKRVTYEEGGQVWIRMGVICGAAKEPCDALVRDFQALNDRIRDQMQNRKP